MTHLHVHSNHSLLEGVVPITDLVARAAACGMQALALTDSGGLYGAIPFYQTAKAAGIKPILGVNIESAVVLARDREGYAELCRLVTAYRLEEGFRLADWPFVEHFFVLCAERAVIEALHARGIRPLVAVTHYGDARSRYRASQSLALARRWGLRPVAVNPVYFLEPGHARIHRVLSAIRRNTTIACLGPADVAHPRAWFRTPDEMARLYAEWPETLANAEWVAEQCNLELPLGKPLFPEFSLPRGETPFSFLWKQAFRGVAQRYRPLTAAVMDRLRYELDVIRQLGFASYFLIVWDIVQYARQQGIPIVGRGSAANSLVAYVLDVTRADPLKYDLYFERFLNLSRTDCPDIDLDICWRRRDAVINYVYTKYGADRVAMIATFNTFQARSAIRETAKAFGLTDREIGEVARRLPHYRARDIRTVTEYLPECRGLRFDQEPLKSILEIGEFIDGFPRHLSIHSGGLVIAPEPLTRFTPLQRAAKGILITQYDMYPIEDLGLVKIDLLGHRSLTVIDETVEKVRENRGILIDVERLPEPDKLTGGLIREGRTIGCFQIESPAMRALLRHVGADNTDMLIKTLSLIRPGPSGSGMKKHFIDRHLGREETVYLHPALRAVLGDTYGVMLYQEDILKVANVIAGMNLAEADALRRAMSKRRSPDQMARSMKGFLEKAIVNGVEASVAEAIWGLIANFSEYAYCKAHASTYGELAYQCTYLKAHFPAEFLASVLSNRGGFYHPAVYLEEARRCGIEIRPPDVNKSAFTYTVEGEAVRVGLVELRGLSHCAVKGVIEARQSSPFRTFGDLYRRARLSPSDAEILIHAGACDGFGQTRPQLLWEGRLYQRAAEHEGASASQLVFHYPDVSSRVPRLPDYSRKKRADLEWTTCGLAISTHPIEYYLPEVVGRLLVLSADLALYAGRQVTLVGWLIAERRVGLKGRGCMKFLTLEDPAGVFEAVLFPRAYQEYGDLLTSHGPYFITGNVQDENGYCSLIVERLERIGHCRKSTGVSEITPPFRWLFPEDSPDDVAHAD
jgi:DNA-directed DNA polymerase III PolC